MDFKLDEFVKVAVWKKYSYDVEAETLEQAINKIIDGEVENSDYEEFYDTEEYVSPSENNEKATYEIYCNNELVYSNKDV